MERTTLSPSSSETSGFRLLRDDLQRWIWDKGWTALHEVQERAIEPLLAGDRDVILAAATASGGTGASRARGSAR